MRIRVTCGVLVTLNSLYRYGGRENVLQIVGFLGVIYRLLVCINTLKVPLRLTDKRTTLPTPCLYLKTWKRKDCKSLKEKKKSKNKKIYIKII